jgi:beta-glucanase (GH16 family)
MAPPAADALQGYTQSYVNDFSASVPSGWEIFTGQPGGDPGAQWGSSHVTEGSGMLQLNTWKDPAYGDAWVAGGVCQCNVQNQYGAYFVRSRVTGAGPTGVQLLWPASNSWPPEIDFNESNGTTSKTTATVHYTSRNLQDQRDVGTDLTQWHTWGVIWTPTTITYTVDGTVWGVVSASNEIPSVPMTLDLTQQTWCDSGFACPTAPESMQVDWVAEYVPS